MYNRGGYIFARVIGLILTLLLAGIILLQTPGVQTRVSRAALELIEDRFDGAVEFSSMEILPLNALILKDVTIHDRNPYINDQYDRGWEPEDTLFHAASVSATFGLRGLFEKEGLHLRRVSISDACMHLMIEPCQEPDRPVITNLERIFRLKKPKGVVTEGPAVFDIRHLKISNMHYRMNSFIPEKRAYSGHGINYDDMDVRVDAKGHNLKFTGSRMYAVADMIRVRDKCGYEVKKLSGRCKVGMGRAQIDNIHLIDEWSDIRVRSYSMSYRSGRDFAHFTELVRIEGEIGGGTLSTRTLSGFTGALSGSDATLQLASGHIEGYINDLAVKGLAFTELDSGISGVIDAGCVGIPDVGSMNVHAGVKDLRFTTEAIDKAISAFAPGTDLNIRRFAQGMKFTAGISASGPVNRLGYDIRLESRKQSFTAKGDVRNLAAPGRFIELSANAAAKSLDLSRIAGLEFAGPATATLEAGAVLDKENPTIVIDRFDVEQARILGRDYQGISLTGDLASGMLDAVLSSTDPAISLTARTRCRFPSEGEEGHYDLSASISNADLKAMGLFREEVRAESSADIRVSFSGAGEFLNGNVEVSGITLTRNDGVHELGKIDMDMRSSKDNFKIDLKSVFADITYRGSKNPAHLWNDICNETLRRDIPALINKPCVDCRSGDYDIRIDFHDTRDLFSALIPGLYIADGTNAKLDLSPRNGLLLKVLSPRIAFKTNYVKAFDLSVDNLDHSLNAVATGSEVKFAGLALTDAAVTGYAQDNAFSVSMHYDNSAGRDNVGELYLNGNFERDAADSLIITAHPLSSYIVFDDQFWDFSESEITFRGKDIHFDGFRISCDEQSILIDGGISSSEPDTLSVVLNRFDLGILDNFFVKDSGIRGRASGKAFITSPTNGGFGMLMNISSDSLAVGGTNAGSVKLASMWDESASRFNIFMSNMIDGRDAIYAHADYTPSGKELEFSANFKEFNLAVLSPILSDVMSETAGSISGSLMARGPVDRLEIGSENLYLDDAMVRVRMTGVPYYLSGPLRATGEGIYFDSVKVRDDGNGSGTLNGALRYDHLRDMSLDARIEIRDLKVIDLQEQGNNGFYGHLSADGRAYVSGPFEAIQIDADISTSGEGDIHIPLNSASIGTTSDLLTFMEPEKEQNDPYEDMIASLSTRKINRSDIYAKARVRASRDVRAYMEIEKSTGNVMTVSGDGSVSLEIRPAKDIFNFNGDYSISEGSYHFVIPGILERDFGITEGSSIKFGGDIMDTELNVNTQHIVKTSLSTLLSDTTALATRRTVECGLSISDKIRNPRFGFSIEVPDLDPTTKALVESSLNTEDKIQKQFLSLLLFGTFFPSDQSGIVNSGNMLYSNVTGVMSNQLNSILQKLEIPLDFGLGYQQNQNGADIFDVAVSTQLFNNKVLVNGSVGNRQYSTSTNPRGDVVGDLDIEIKLDNPGQFRLNLFSHSADEYTSFLDFSQRNGVGLSYQKEFNKPAEIIRDIFSSRKKKDERRSRAGQGSRSRDTKTITIGKDDEQTVSDTDSAR